MKPWHHLVESDTEERALLRKLLTDPHNEQIMASIKNMRIRMGKARRFDRIVALVGPHGVWRNEWVDIDHWTPEVDDDRFDDEYGYDENRYENTWLIGVGAGFLTVRYLVLAHNEDDAYEIAMEQWPDVFNPDDEEDAPEVRLIVACETWAICRKKGAGVELLNGMMVRSV